MGRSHVGTKKAPPLVSPEGVAKNLVGRLLKRVRTKGTKVRELGAPREKERLGPNACFLGTTNSKIQSGPGTLGASKCRACFQRPFPLGNLQPFPGAFLVWPSRLLPLFTPRGKHPGFAKLETRLRIVPPGKFWEGKEPKSVLKTPNPGG